MSTIDAPLPAAPRLDGPAPHVLVVRAPYYAEVVDGLRDGAAQILPEAGATYDVLDVAGALELAGAIRLAAVATRAFDAYVALGCVVRGETDHYEYVCREAMAGLTRWCCARAVPRQRAADRGHARSGHRAVRAGRAQQGCRGGGGGMRQLGAARWLAGR